MRSSITLNIAGLQTGHYRETLVTLITGKGRGKSLSHSGHNGKRGGRGVTVTVGKSQYEC